MHANLYNYELIKIQHQEAQRVAVDERYAAVARRARRRTRRALWVRVTPDRGVAARAVTH